jgi:hypothetical protein
MRTAATLALAASLASSHLRADSTPADITILYSSGLPVESMKQRNHPDPDALTSPTPADSSVKVVVTELADALKQRGVSARLVPVAEVSSYRDLLTSPVLILAGSSHFGRADWGLKKVLDERIGAFVATRQGHLLAPLKIFALGHSEGGINFSSNVVTGVTQALQPLGITLAGEFRTVNSTGWSADERRAAVAAAAETLAAVVKP